jgi:hypothetical protein
LSKGSLLFIDEASFVLVGLRHVLQAVDMLGGPLVKGLGLPLLNE